MYLVSAIDEHGVAFSRESDAEAFRNYMEDTTGVTFYVTWTEVDPNISHEEIRQKYYKHHCPPPINLEEMLRKTMAYAAAGVPSITHSGSVTQIKNAIFSAGDRLPRYFVSAHKCSVSIDFPENESSLYDEVEERVNRYLEESPNSNLCVLRAELYDEVLQERIAKAGG